jgi:hypothetical protein
VAVVNVIMNTEILQSCASVLSMHWLVCAGCGMVEAGCVYVNVTLRSVRVTIDSVEKQ